MKTLFKEIEKWLYYYKKNNIRVSSFNRYRSVVKLIGKYEIGDVLVKDLTSWQFQNYINQLVEDGYSRETILKQYKVLTEFLLFAMNEGELQKPIYSQVRVPSETNIKKKRRGIVSYTAAEQESLKDVLFRGDSLACLAGVLMLETGMRAGEVLALTWDDIDFRRRAVTISKTTVYSIDKRSPDYVQKEPKTYSSIRTIPLSKDAMRAIEIIRNRDNGLSDYLFHDENGDCFTYCDLRWWVRKSCNEAGVPYYGQHVFRHTFATNCYYKGCDVKLLSKMLGHSSTSITYNTYIHLYGDSLEEMRSILD